MEFRRSLKRLVSLCIILSMAAGTMPFFSYAAASGEYNWTSEYVSLGKYKRGFRPEDKYVSVQNPTSFTWPYVEAAESFDLILCGDEALTDVKYKWEGIKLNLYTPGHTLETGVTYYWAVRYYIKGKPGEWSEPRRLRIDPDAHEAVMDDIDTIMARIPSSHPRVFTTPEKLEEFRSLKDTNQYSKRVYEKYLEDALKYVQEGNLYGDANAENAVIDKNASSAVQSIQYTNYINDAANDMTDQIMACGFVYLISGDKEIGEYGRKAMLKLSEWDVNGASSPEKATQANRLIAICMARAYDWLYDLFSEEDKKIILNVIKQRTDPISIYPEYNRENPYGSHEWTRYMYAGIVAYATYGEIEGYEKLLRDTIESFSMVPTWSYEDGGWSQGVGYYNSRQIDKDFVDLLALGGVVNFYNRAWYRNEYLYTTYAVPIGSYGGFGEGAGLGRHSADFNLTNGMKRTAYFSNNPYAKWYAENSAGMWAIDDISDYYANMSADVKSESPAELQLSHVFKDIGVANLTNDLTDPNRIQLTFRSSPYGTYSHSFSDNNGILISAFGENLLIHSGYYDAFGSPHEQNIYRNSTSNNTVTIANSKGQNLSDIEAKGKITNFLNHVDFDLLTGDATRAYSGIKLGRFRRNVVYIRPDIFVVIDDLKASDNENKTAKFEWWLNALDDISVYENGNGVRLQQNNAVLDVSVEYPKNVKTFYNDIWANSTMKEYNPEGSYANSSVHRRAWFETEKANETKIVVALDVHQNHIAARDVDTECFEGYIKMTFEDGTIMYVNTGDSAETVSAGDIVFNGDAVVYNDDSVMLVNGTSLILNGTELVKSEGVVSVCMGKDELGISSECDNRVSVNTNNDYIDGLNSVTEYNGRELSPAIGISYEKGILKEAEAGKKSEEEKSYTVEESEAYVTFTSELGHYSLMLNGKQFKTEEVTGEVTVDADGERKKYQIKGYTKRDGSVNYQGAISVPSKKYKVVEKNKELDFAGNQIGDIRGFSTVDVSTDSAVNYIKLESIESKKLNTTYEADYDAVRNRASVFVEAEDYTGKIADGARVYTTRSFLSGGKGISSFNNIGTQIKYNIEIKEAGVYDLAVKYVSWISTDSDKGTSVRSFNILGKDYEFGLDRKTDGFGSTPEQWHTAITDSGLELEPGTYEITFEVVSGSWNYDWIVLLKR